MSPIDQKQFNDQLTDAQLAPLWEKLKSLVPAEPVAQARPWKWRFEHVKHHLLRAGELITAEQAERRVLVLQNPGLNGKLQITDTLYAGLQLILPGEKAPPHRHSQSALRFVIEGSGASTTVEGVKVAMHPGDFIITPAMTWHAHEGGNEPVVWLDGLDVPLVSFMNTGFREECALTRANFVISPEQTDINGRTPVFSYPYERSRQALHDLRHEEMDACHGFSLRYTNPFTGDWAIPTIATSLRLLPAGFDGLPYRSTDGVVYVVLEGRLVVHIGDLKFECEPKDTVTVPGWTDHRVSAPKDAVFFAFSDRAAQEKLGLWRDERSARQIKEKEFPK